jgi:hypothetical protein
MVSCARLPWVLGLIATLGCQSNVGPEPGGPITDPGPPDPPVCADAPSPGPSPLRRLTRFEYNNTARELLGDDSRPASQFPPEEIGNGFGNDATALAASQLLVEGYASAARKLALRATSAESFAAVVGCEPEPSNALECATRFVQSFGARAYRRPLEPAEQDRLLKLFDSSYETRSFTEAVADVLTVILQSPRFLYRVELDEPANSGVAALSSYELASRLSYLLWGSMPDQALFERAATGRLVTAAQVREEAQRLLGDTRAHHVMRYFHANLFGISGLDYLAKSPESFPNFTPELGALMRRESEIFLDHAVWEDDGKFSTLLSASYTFMNAPLAAFYGVDGPAGDDFERVELEPTQRAGILTQAGVMAALTPGAATNPVLRGAYLRGRLFCDPPPDPPANLMVEEPAANPDLTTRERFAQHRTDTACNTCHALLDPLGLPFENFDGLGQWRETENGKPIDASGDLVGTDVAGPLSGGAEVARRIAQSGQAQRCYANQWMSYAYGRGFAPEDACMRRKVESAFATADGAIPELLLELTQTDAFMYRSEEAP